MSLKNLENRILKKAQAFEEVQKACQLLLRTHPIAQKAKEYILKRVSSNNLDLFEFGYMPSEENLDILISIVNKDILSELNLVYPYHVQNGDQRVFIDKAMMENHNITMPYRDFSGNIVALVGRTFLNEEDRKLLKLSKYKYTQFKKSLQLFGLHQAKKSIIKKRSVVLVEGQIDCITCHEYGIDNVVALGGASLSKRQFETISWLAESIYLLLDNDSEGERARDRIIRQYSKDIQIKILRMPEKFKDIDECLHQGYNAFLLFDKIQ